MQERIAVIGLGYVGLPVALAFARKFAGTIGFDVSAARVNELRNGADRSGEVDDAALRASTLKFSADATDLEGCTFFVVAVPTPIDKYNRPDLDALLRASETVGRALRRGGIVVYESTVYPGVTEDICAPVLERVSGLRCGTDFQLGYSPERINPGDRDHTLSRVTKVVSGSDIQALERVAQTYQSIVEAGVHRAPSIRVAEAAKVLENTQRDINIALMNELAVICDRLNIRTRDVLDAARTKWNFLPFSPGLVGGHCIGVDPYYLTAKAQEVGYHPEVILAGRRINDQMGVFVAQKAVKMLVHSCGRVKGLNVGIFGLTFKENVPDLRNSRVPDICRELISFGVNVRVHDPLADAAEAKHEYGIELSRIDDMHGLDGAIIAVSHTAYEQIPTNAWAERLNPNGIVVDVRSILDAKKLPPTLSYWSL